MNPVRLYDAGSAIVASQVNNAHGGKARPYDFMPYAERPPEPEPDEVVKLMMADPSIKRGR